jgi:uncharacterized damage-inducible protein DinB
MNADAFRHFYNYHFAENRRIWDCAAQLSPEQFTQPVAYSHGSVREQIVHLMSVDEGWFCELRGAEFPEPFSPADGDDRKLIRARWDSIVQDMRDYLANLGDEMLFTKPIKEPDEDKGTDHRAQLLRVLHDLGVKTTSQDYIFYVYDHL